MRFVCLFGIGFANIIALQLAQVNVYTRKDLKSFRIQSFYLIMSDLE